MLLLGVNGPLGGTVVLVLGVMISQILRKLIRSRL